MSQRERIKTDARSAKKDPAVYLAHINLSDASIYCRVHGCFEIERNVESAGEQIKCSEGQHSENLSGVSQHRGNPIDCPVAARGDNDFASLLAASAANRAISPPSRATNRSCSNAALLKELLNLRLSLVLMATGAAI